jgi:PHD/YefM family antitoxin component YafN of YafNO toxin-antitoxin module
MCYDLRMDDRGALPFPVAGEITEATWDQVAEGQPVLLLRNGRPAAVIVDVESWVEAELATTQPA